MKSANTTTYELGGCYRFVPLEERKIIRETERAKMEGDLADTSVSWDEWISNCNEITLGDLKACMHTNPMELEGRVNNKILSDVKWAKLKNEEIVFQACVRERFLEDIDAEIDITLHADGELNCMFCTQVVAPVIEMYKDVALYRLSKWFKYDKKGKKNQKERQKKSVTNVKDSRPKTSQRT